ncbi:MAG: tRNA pseudouridine(55) synthase TruB, partial [Candidatus Gracilibacteria bacterium]
GIVKTIKRLSREAHVGHAGTLDPLATGLLILALGEATKLLEYFIGSDKEYEVSACFGKESDTYDAEGKIISVDEKMFCDSEEITSVIKKKFMGEIDQMPPKYSALKVKGKRACDILRKGGDVELKARKILVSRFDLKEFDWPNVSFRVKCGSGTYIRSLIHDLGKELKCGAYVTVLRRTKVGDFSVDWAKDVSYFEEKIERIEKSLLSLELIGEKFKKIELAEDDYDGLKNGGIVVNKKFEQTGFLEAPVMAYCNDLLAGVVELSKDQKGIKFRKMIVR